MGGFRDHTNNTALLTMTPSDGGIFYQFLILSQTEEK